MSVLDSDITLAKQGDAGAFERIYHETIKGAFYVAKKYLGSDALAEDVLQESYIKVYEKLDTYQTGNFQGWVDIIVANRCRDYLRKKNPLLFSEMETEDGENSIINNVVESKMEFQPDAQVDYNETKRLVLEIIDNLPADQRMSVMMFYYEEMSVKDIAAACECSENTIKSRLNYGRKAIKSQVEALEKKGTKLYAVPFLPFLVWLFKEEAKACTVPAALTYTAVAGNAVVGVLQGASAAGQVGAGASQSGVFGSAAAQAAVGTAAKTGLGLGAKIAIGVVAALAVGGGVTTAVVLNQGNEPKTEMVADQNNNNGSSVQETTQEATAVAPAEYVGGFFKEGKAQVIDKEGGTSVTILSYDGKKTSFIVSSCCMNASKVEQFKIESADVVNGKAEYTFDNAGWGSYGHGSIEFLQDGSLRVNVVVDGWKEVQGASWSMSGEKDQIFYKDGIATSKAK